MRDYIPINAGLLSASRYAKKKRAGNRPASYSSRLAQARDFKQGLSMRCRRGGGKGNGGRRPSSRVTQSQSAKFAILFVIRPGREVKGIGVAQADTIAEGQPPN